MNKKTINMASYISVRVTLADRHRLNKRAAGSSLSDYIRGQILGARSREPLRLTERVSLNHLGRIGDLVGDYLQHVAKSSTLKRGDIISFLSGIEADLHAVRLAILRCEADDGDC